jgi:uncharacterized protein HemX
VSHTSGSGVSGGAERRGASLSRRAARDSSIADEAGGEFAADAKAEVLAAEHLEIPGSEGSGTERLRTSSLESPEREGAGRGAPEVGQAEASLAGAALNSSQGGGTVPPGARPAARRDRERDGDHSRTAMVLGGTAIVLALAVAAWTYNRFDRIESEVTRRLQTAEQRGAGIESSLQQSQNLVRDLQNRSSVLESRIAETAGLQAQLEKLYRERAEDTLEVLLVETEGALSLASQQLALGANPQGVLAALEDIERRLARQNEARLGPVQAALLRDIEMLRVYPASDVSSLALRIDALIGALDHLPLLASIRDPLETSNGIAEPAPTAPARAVEAPAQGSAAGPSSGTSPSSATGPVGASSPAGTTASPPAPAPAPGTAAATAQASGLSQTGQAPASGPAAAPGAAQAPATGQDTQQGEEQAQTQAQAQAEGSPQVPAQSGPPAASQVSTLPGMLPATPATEQAGAQAAGDPQAGGTRTADETGSMPPGESAAAPQQASAQQSVPEHASQTEPPQQQAQAPASQAPAAQASAPKAPAPQPPATREQAPQQAAQPPAESPPQPAQQAPSQPAPQQAASQPSKADSGTSRLTATWNAVRKELRELFNVRRIDAPDAMLMSPQQAYFLRQNLRLMLLNARLALLTRNEEVYRADLERARRWIGSYYDSEHRNVVAVQAQLRQLIDARLVLEPPRIDESLAAVRLARTTVR